VYHYEQVATAAAAAAAALAAAVVVVACIDKWGGDQNRAVSAYYIERLLHFRSSCFWYYSANSLRGVAQYYSSYKRT
jgi:hypothetical protein